jgi:NAD(P)H dehydrogenase (quinone)
MGLWRGECFFCIRGISSVSGIAIKNENIDSGTGRYGYVFNKYAEAMVSNYVNAYENTDNVLANNMADGKMAYISRDDCALAAACAAMSDWEDRVVMVTFGRAIRLGQMAVHTDDFEKLTGQKPLTVRQIFEDLENHLVGQRTSTEK